MTFTLVRNDILSSANTMMNLDLRNPGSIS